jgi:hypothetical protein
MLCQIQPYAFLVLTYPQLHYRINELEEHGADYK